MVEHEAGWEERLMALGVEALVVANWERLLSAGTLARFRCGCWNLHPSLLPRWRGHNPYFHVIASGEAESGVTVHRMTEELDRGPILLSRRLSLASDETLGTLWNRLAVLAGEAWLAAYPLVAAGEPALKEQPDGDYPVAHPVKEVDLMLHPGRDVDATLRLVRASTPFYGARVVVDGRRLRVYAADLPPDEPRVDEKHEALIWRPQGAPGGARLLLRCRDGWVRATLAAFDGEEAFALD